MKTQKQASPFSNMSDEQLIFFGFDDLSSMIKHEAPSDKSVLKVVKVFLDIMNLFANIVIPIKLLKLVITLVSFIQRMVKKILLKFRDITAKNAAHILKLNFQMIMMLILIFTKIH